MSAKSSIVTDKSCSNERVALVTAAKSIGMSPNGLLHILQKTASAIRDDGHWFCTIAIVERIKNARRDLGARGKVRASITSEMYA